VAECDACSVAYTYHQVDTCLRCHTCGAWKPVPARCPGCADPAFRYAGFGTQRIEVIVKKCFPKARIARMDADATARRHSHDEILGEFRAGRTDILIGTQMIAKGLDFPNVTLVGVLLADASLHMPDFRAGERTFQLLAQVSGRAGRGEVPGEVIVQTYSPEHPAVAAARDAAFERFATTELSDRHAAGFPPYAHLVCLTFKGADEAKVAFVAQAFAKALASRAGSGVVCAEALPSPLARAKGDYRYQVLLRASSVRAITTPLRTVVRDLQPPADVVLTVDVDALSIM
jgi:primosomal protein N' (replication factor Y) (superfamily II helicase)